MNKNAVIILLCMLLAVTSWSGANGFPTEPTPYEFFCAVLFGIDVLFLVLYIFIEIKD